LDTLKNGIEGDHFSETHSVAVGIYVEQWNWFQKELVSVEDRQCIGKNDLQ
jgi:hypothetical protein